MRRSRLGADAGAMAALLGDHPADLLTDLDEIDPGFDEWLAAQRVRCREEREGVAMAVARRALAAGDAAGAYDVAARLLAAEPFNEAAARLAMEASGQLGDTGRVRRVYARCRDAMRGELDAPPSPDTVALHDRLTAGLASTEPPQRQNVRPPELQPVAPPAAPPRRRLRRPLIAAMAAGVAVFGVLAISPGEGKRTRIVRIEPVRAPAGDSVAQAVGHGLAGDLSHLMVGVDAGLDVAAADDPRASGAAPDFIVASDALTSGAEVRASARLLDAASGSILWSHSFTRPAAEVDGLRDQLAARVADVMVCGLGGRNPGVAALGVETTRLYLRACEEKHGDWGESAKLLAQIVKARPRFAHAWAMLAAATGANATEFPDAVAAPQHRLAEAYAHRALALDPHDSETYLGLVYDRPGLSRWPQRHALLLAARAIDPSNDCVDVNLAEELMAIGRRNAAIPIAQRAVELGPFNQWAVSTLIADYSYAGQPELALPLIDLARRRWPDDPDVGYTRFAVAAHVGDPAEAERLMTDPRRTFYIPPERGPFWDALLKARQDKALIAPAVKLFADDIPAADADALFADADGLVLLGRPDLALAAFDRIGADPAPPTSLLFRDYMAPVRADPRFMAFAERQGLLSVWQRTGLWPDFCGQPGLPYDCRHAATDAAARPAPVPLQAAGTL